MKHLRRYNKSKEARHELLDFCSMYLAYLLDDGWTISISNYSEESYMIYLNIPEMSEEAIRWGDVKNNILPFIELLSRKYGSTCSVSRNGGKTFEPGRVFRIDTDNVPGGTPIYVGRNPGGICYDRDGELYFTDLNDLKSLESCGFDRIEFWQIRIIVNKK